MRVSAAEIRTVDDPFVLAQDLTMDRHILLIPEPAAIFLVRAINPAADLDDVQDIQPSPPAPTQRC
jgi:hypothetical protein